LIPSIILQSISKRENALLSGARSCLGNVYDAGYYSGGTPPKGVAPAPMCSITLCFKQELISGTKWTKISLIIQGWGLMPGSQLNLSSTLLCELKAGFHEYKQGGG